MSWLYRFDQNGRYVARISQDQPLEAYAGRIDVDLTPDQPPAAPIGYVPYRQAGRWVLVAQAPEQPSLAEVKAQKWRDMKTKRQAALCAPLVTPYGTFDADDDSRDNIAKTAQGVQTKAQSLAPLTQPTVDFTLADDTTVTLTASQMIAVAVLLFDRSESQYARGRVVRAAIEAATTTQQVSAITWSTP